MLVFDFLKKENWTTCISFIVRNHSIFKRGLYFSRKYFYWSIWSIFCEKGSEAHEHTPFHAVQFFSGSRSSAGKGSPSKVCFYTFLMCFSGRKFEIRSEQHMWLWVYGSKLSVIGIHGRKFLFGLVFTRKVCLSCRWHAWSLPHCLFHNVDCFLAFHSQYLPSSVF